MSDPQNPYPQPAPESPLQTGAGEAPPPENSPAAAQAPAAAEPPPFWAYHDVLILAGLALVMFLATGMLASVVFQPMKISAFQAIVVTFVFEGLCLLMLVGIIRFGYQRPFWRSIRWLPVRYGFWRCLNAGILAAVVLVALGSILPKPPDRTLMEQLLQDRKSILLVGCFAVTLGPLFEELAFRGFLMPLLVRTFGSIAGIALQALPFALLHGVEYAWAWQQLILMFLAGAAFGWMRYKTASVAASTYMHAGYNLVAFVGILAQSFFR